MRHRTCFDGIVILALWLSMTAPSHGSTTGQLPLSYRISAGSFPWTGRLHAIVFRTARIHTSTVLTKWEAGAELDLRDTASRRLYLGGDRLVPFHWRSIDADAQAELHTPEPSGNGTRRLAWLRGDRTDATLRPRDTRLASGAGARVRVVAAPAWLPMQPGHAQFRLRHANRAVTVWIGTRDGIVHGFDAVTGKELAGFLPRAALAGSAALTVPGSAMPVAPCPRPDSIDADPSGVWRTLLLCGIPSTDRQAAGRRVRPGCLVTGKRSADPAALGNSCFRGVAIDRPGPDPRTHVDRARRTSLGRADHHHRDTGNRLTRRDCIAAA